MTTDPRPWPRRALPSVVEKASRPLKRASAALTAAHAAFARFRLVDLAYAPRRDDVFLVSYPGSGTAWAQMILHQLTSDGSMDFPHISALMPHLERVPMTKRDLEALPSPRVFRTHQPYEKVLKSPAKYLYLVRDGGEVTVQYYRLAVAHLGFQGSFAQFFERFLRGDVPDGSWFDHVAGWWAHRGELDVLFVQHAELGRDLPGAIQRIARFSGIAVDPARLPGILERSSLAMVKRHDEKFNHLQETLWERGYRAGSFLRKGKAGEGAVELSAAQRAAFDRALRKKLGGVLPATADVMR